MIRKTTIFIMVLVLLSSCWDVEEADRMDYTHGVGIDYKDGELIVHIQLVNLGTLGTPDTAAAEESQTTIATITSTNLNEAIFEIYRSAQRRIYWGHTTFILLSEAALKETKLVETLDFINRFSQTRYRIQVGATQSDDLIGIMEATPIFESSPIFTRLTDLNNAYEQNSFIQPVSIRELIIMLDEPGYNGIIPVVKLNEDTWTSEQNPEPMIEIDGVACVTSDKFQGMLLGEDVRGLRWLNEDSERNDITIEQDGKAVSELVVVTPKADITIDTEGEQITFHVDITAKGMINVMLEDLDEEKIKEEVEKEIKKEVMNTFTKALEMDSDIYRLSEKLYRRDLKTWQKVEQDGMVPLTENSLKVEVDIDLGDAKLNKTEPIIR